MNQSTASSDPTNAHDADGRVRPTSWSFATGFTLSALLALAIVRPNWVPLFLGAAFAVTLGPVFRWLRAVLGGRETLAAAITTVMLLFVVLSPLASLVAYAANEVAQGIEWLKETMQLDNVRELIGGRVPAPVRSLLERTLENFNLGPDELQEYGKRGVELAQQATPKVAGASLALLGNTLLLLLSCFFFLADGGKLVSLIMHTSPLRGGHTRELMDEFRSVASASLMGMAFTGVGQCLVLTAGFYFAGVPHLFFFGVGALVAAFVPLVGSMLVWLPVSVGLAVTGSTYIGVGLAVYSLVATNVVDGGLKPLVLRGQMAMHGGLLFLGILGGLSLFGPVGVVAGPLCIAFFTTFLTIYQRDYLKQEPVEG